MHGIISLLDATPYDIIGNIVILLFYLDLLWPRPAKKSAQANQISLCCAFKEKWRLHTSFMGMMKTIKADVLIFRTFNFRTEREVFEILEH